VLGGALESDGVTLDMVWTFWGDRWQLWTRYIADDGFLLAGTGNTLSLNKAKGSKGFDLYVIDPGANIVADDNDFKTTFQ